MAYGWISIHRKIRDCWLWQDKPYDRARAWIDMILTANHEDKKVLIGNKLIAVERGSFITSQVKLMERWGWGKSKLISFLKLLESDNMIIITTTKTFTTIKILNYEIYQKQTDTNSDIPMDSDIIQTTSRLQTDYKQTINGQQTDTNNNDNNVNKNNIVSAKQTPYLQIKNLFNSICTTLPKIKGIEGNRQKVVQSRWREHSDLKFFENIFKQVDKSEFLSGRNDKWKGCCFDWIMKPSNIQKILEGNYENKEIPKQPPPKNDFDFTGL